MRAVVIALLALVTAACSYQPKNQGQALYNAHCQSCHMEKGQGLGKLYPPISDSDYVSENSDRLACIIRHGMTGKVVVNGITYDGEMAGNARLTEVEVSNLVQYILTGLNQRENPYTIKDIKVQLDACE